MRASFSTCASALNAAPSKLTSPSGIGTVEYFSLIAPNNSFDKEMMESVNWRDIDVINNMKKQGHYHMFEMIMEQKEHEKYLYNKYAAVKKAYEHYSLMLKLAESGEL